MERNKSVLIVCYAYPPYPGVGGRRWAKFSRLLAERGYDVKVICSENPHPKKSEWMMDTKNVQVTALPLNYPKSLILYPGGLMGRIRYRLSLAYVKLFTKRNYYDRAVFWEKQLTDAMNTLIRSHSIRNVIVSGAPFSLFSYVADLRKRFAHLNLIADIRDPWTTNEMAYGFSSISSKRLAFEKHCEQTVFNAFDKVTTVNDRMTDYFRKLYAASPEKFMTVENGFDPAEVSLKEDPALNVDPAKTNLVFTGTFYDKALYLFENLLDALRIAHGTKGKDQIHFFFFGPNMGILKKRVEAAGFSRLFTFGNYNDIAQVNALISKADFCLLFLTDDINYSFSTKFCEYIKFRRKVLVFSREGLTGRFVRENRIGHHVNAGQEARIVEELCAGHLKLEKFSGDFDAQQFSIESLVEKYTALLN